MRSTGFAMRTGVPLCARELSMAHADSSPVTEIIGECANLTVRNWLLAVPTVAVTFLACLPILVYGMVIDPRVLSSMFSGGTAETQGDIFAANTPAFWVAFA